MLVPWRLARGGKPLERRAVLLAFLGGAFFALDIALFNTAVLRTSVANATLLGSNAPIFVGLATWFVFHKRPPLSFWIGLALALAGCALIVAAGALWSASGPTDLTGDLLALSCAVFWAAYMLTAERVRTHMDTLTFNTLAIVGSVLTLLPICLLLDLPLSGYSGRTWASLFGLGLVSQLASYFALVYALGHLPATLTSVGFLAQVPLTALLAVLVFGEPISGAQIAGGVLVLAGIYVVNRPTGPSRQPPASTEH